jgi:hypothetical protein
MRTTRKTTEDLFELAEEEIARARKIARGAELDLDAMALLAGGESIGRLIDSSTRVDSPALVIPIAANRKLGPVDMVDVGLPRKRPVPRRPYVASTYLPVAQSCPSSCTFRDNGCMAQSGYTGRAVRRLEVAAADMSHYEIEAAEARALDRLLPRGVPRDGGRDGRSPRDLRLHVSGDVGSVPGLRAIAAAVDRLKARGLGSAWTFTHAWRSLPREIWEPISVLASVEASADAELAWALGYAPAIVVPRFPGTRTFELGGFRWTPCPAELRKATCATCRLCLDGVDRMHAERRGIAFAVHGPGAEDAKRRLPVIAP